MNDALCSTGDSARDPLLQLCAPAHSARHAVCWGGTPEAPGYKDHGTIVGSFAPSLAEHEPLLKPEKEKGGVGFTCGPEFGAPSSRSFLKQ